MTLFRACLIMFATILVGCASATDSKMAKIERAQSAAPSTLSSMATVLDTDGTMLKAGSSDWICYPGIPLIPGDMHPMCNDSVWRDFLKAASEGKPFTTDHIGISYMLQGDAHVSNSNPMAMDPNNGDVWVQEGPHLMLAVPTELLEGLSDDPYNGGPYVMWKGTPFAHIMIPLGSK